jgi:hypothetical protein
MTNYLLKLIAGLLRNKNRSTNEIYMYYGHCSSVDCLSHAVSTKQHVMVKMNKIEVVLFYCIFRRNLFKFSEVDADPSTLTNNTLERYINIT